MVDDEEGVRRFLGRVLGGDGHEVKTADNDALALGTIKDNGCDLILLDIKFQGMSEIELYRLLVSSRCLYQQAAILCDDVASL